MDQYIGPKTLKKLDGCICNSPGKVKRIKHLINKILVVPISKGR